MMNKINLFLRILGWLFLALSILGFVVTEGSGDEAVISCALISIALFISSSLKELKPKLSTFKGSTLTEKK